MPSLFFSAFKNETTEEFLQEFLIACFVFIDKGFYCIDSSNYVNSRIQRHCLGGTSKNKISSQVLHAVALHNTKTFCTKITFLNKISMQFFVLHLSTIVHAHVPTSDYISLNLSYHFVETHGVKIQELFSSQILHEINFPIIFS